MKTNIGEEYSQNEFFFNKDGKAMMGNKHHYGHSLVDYSDIYLKDKADFDGNYEYTGKLIQSILGNVFKITVSSTGIYRFSLFKWHYATM